MVDESEREMKVLFKQVIDVLEFIRSFLDSSTVNDKFKYLIELKRVRDGYIEFFTENFDNFPKYKQPLYSRQRATVEKKCIKAVESLDFEYETDFLYALSLD